MAEEFIAFGPSTNHFVKHQGWSAKCDKNSNGKYPVDSLKAKGKPYCLSFGDNGSWFVVSEHGNNRLSQYDSSGLRSNYPSLHEWIQSLGTSWDARNMFVCLGPDGAYFGSSKGSGVRWNNVHPDLIQKIRDTRGSSPKVALGLKSSFVFWTDSGEYRYHLPACQSALEWLKENLGRHRRGVKIVTASVSPFQEDIYFFLLSDGKAIWRVPESWKEKVQLVVNHYKQRNPPAVSASA